jgi:leucyl/phenylalanyl-tRNA--protein transferase
MLPILDPFDSEEPFPDVELALEEPNGLLAVGGNLSPVRLRNAYRQGIFPWFNEGEPILWWSPDPRWVLPPAEVRISRSLGKRLKRGEFNLTYDRAFADVVRACAEPRSGTDGTWINPAMQRAYRRLHQVQLAHSFEVWRENELVGGLYGVTIGQVFFGESMFHRKTDASKVAFVRGCQKLNEWGYRLIDCQVHTAHLQSLGARQIPRADFARALMALCDAPVAEDAWREPSR